MRTRGERRNEATLPSLGRAPRFDAFEMLLLGSFWQSCKGRRQIFSRAAFDFFDRPPPERFLPRVAPRNCRSNERVGAATSLPRARTSALLPTGDHSTRACVKGFSRDALRPRGASLASRPTNPPASSREPPGFRRKGFRVRTPRGARGVGVSTTQRPSSRPRITVSSLCHHVLTTELTDVPTLTHANTDAERKVHPRQVQHLERLLRRVLRLGQGTHQRGIYPRIHALSRCFS